MLSSQLIMLYSLVVIGIIYVTATSSLAITARDTDRQAVPRERSRCPFIRNSLMNGRVKIRSRGRIAKFICNNGYEILGRRFATCVRGQWNNPIPICVTNGCPVINHPANGEMNVQLSDAVVSFSCDAGYILRGSFTVYCNGISWNDTVPSCDIATTSPELTCDFEDPDICGWSNARYHNFDWRRHQFSTPSGHVGTGPSYDHTLGKNKDGYYMYTETSPPRVVNDSARLFSPVYFPEATPACFVFWYHMFGATTGLLRVYLKKESQVFRELLPLWERKGPQGNLWLQGHLSVPELKENFQIVIEGIRGTGYVGDTAIDDVALYSTPCEDLVVANITRGADSCKNRCFPDEEINATCSCKAGCELVVNSCCDDYDYFCTDFANRTDVGLFSVETSIKRVSTPDETSNLPVETFHPTAVTLESSSTPIINTAELSSDSLYVSSNTSAQTIMAQSSSAGVTTVSALSNGTTSLLNSPTPNISQPLLTMSSSTKVTESISTRKPIINTTSSQTQATSPAVAIEETTQSKSTITPKSSTTTKQIIIPLPSVKTSYSTTMPQMVKSTTPSSKSPSVVMLTANTTSTRNIPIKTTGSTTSSTSTTTASTAPQSATSKRLNTPIFITPAPTMKPILTSQATLPTQSSTYSTHPTTLVQEKSSNYPSSTELFSSSIKSKPFSTERYSKVETTTKISSTRLPLTTKSSTLQYYKKTEKPIDKASTVTTSTRITTFTHVTTKSSTPKAKTSFTYPKQSQDLTRSTTTKSTSISYPTSSIVSPSTLSSRKLTTVYCPEGSLRFPNGQCFPPWTNNEHSSQAVVTTVRTTKLSKSSILVSKTSGTALKVHVSNNTKVSRTKQTSSAIPLASNTVSTNPTVIAYESTEVASTWKPNFKLRTMYRTYVQKPSKKSPVSITMIVALTVGSVSVLVLVVIVGLFVFFRKRKAAQSKLSDDSEMRFLSDSEIVEFADASTKLHVGSG